MGLIQELTRYLEVKGDFSVLKQENDTLKKQLNQALKERDEFEYLFEIQKKRKNDALDEIVLNQKRIDSLLRQLAEKNGGSK